MEINRRQFIAASASVLLFCPTAFFAQSKSLKLLSCRTNKNGEHFFSIVESDGLLSLNIPIPARGHGIALSANHDMAAVFARRPGEFVWVIDLVTQEVVGKVSCKSGRHYYGHGLFTKDGARLLCSENAYETGEGVIGIYDVRNNFVRIGEIQSHGVGPHEFKLLHDEKTLVVANGGIRTHPDLPRIKSNLETMRPNLAYVSIDSGYLLHKHEPETKWHQLSIRHIDISDNDQVAIAMQFEGKPFLQPPLIATQKGEQPMFFLKAPVQVQSQLRNYCGSVAFNADGTKFAVTSPRGGMVTYWSAGGQYLGAHERADACGVSRAMDHSQGFFISDGSGSIVFSRINSVEKVQYRIDDTRWDNHMISQSTS